MCRINGARYDTSVVFRYAGCIYTHEIPYMYIKTCISQGAYATHRRKVAQAAILSCLALPSLLGAADAVLPLAVQNRCLSRTPLPVRYTPYTYDVSCREGCQRVIHTGRRFHSETTLQDIEIGSLDPDLDV